METKAGLPAEASAKAGPKDVFLHLLAILLLYVSAGSFIALWFQYINVWFPDPLAERGYYYLQSAYSSIRWSVAILFVVFPVYVWANWLLRKMYAINQALRELKTRKWLLYLTLFVAGLVIIGDLIMAFFFVGSPKEERARRFDDRRVSDLQAIQGQIINFWQNKERLPTNLAELRDDISGFFPPNDPESGKEYVYEKTADLSFKLCANFNRESLENSPKISRPAVPYPAEPYFGAENWQHASGEICFERTIDPELYKPFEKGTR